MNSMKLGLFLVTVLVIGCSDGAETPGAMDTSQDLGADPTVKWARGFGAKGGDTVYGITGDGAGNEVVVGSVSGAVDFGGGALANGSAYIAKYAKSGGYVWAKVLGGSGSVRANAVSVDRNVANSTYGNITITGSFVGTVNLGGGYTTSNGYPIVVADNFFIASYDSNGQYLWSVTAGSGVDAAGKGVVALSNGDVVVTGAIAGRLDLGCGIVQTASSSIDVLLARYSGSSGGCVWSKVIGGPGLDSGNGIALNASDQLIVAGGFQGTADFGNGARTSAGQSDVFVMKSARDGTLRWVKTFGGAGDDVANAVAFDGAGNTSFAGHFSGTAAFPGATLVSAGSFDGFVATLSVNGPWSRSLGGASTDEAFGVAMDATSGAVVVTGGFQNTADFGAGSLSSAGAWDMFVAKYSIADGTHVWSNRFGGGDDDLGRAVTMLPSGGTFVGGYFGLVASFGGTTLTSAGNADAVLFRLGQ